VNWKFAGTRATNPPTKEASGLIATAVPAQTTPHAAFIGGRLADFRGRKQALLLSILTIGVFQLRRSKATNAR
jgi:MFS family permease